MENPAVEFQEFAILDSIYFHDLLATRRIETEGRMEKEIINFELLIADLNLKVVSEIKMNKQVIDCDINMKSSLSNHSTMNDLEISTNNNHPSYDGIRLFKKNDCEKKMQINSSDFFLADFIKNLTFKKFKTFERICLKNNSIDNLRICSFKEDNLSITTKTYLTNVEMEKKKLKDKVNRGENNNKEIIITKRKRESMKDENNKIEFLESRTENYVKKELKISSNVISNDFNEKNNDNIQATNNLPNTNISMHIKNSVDSCCVNSLNYNNEIINKAANDEMANNINFPCENKMLIEHENMNIYQIQVSNEEGNIANLKIDDDNKNNQLDLSHPKINNKQNNKFLNHSNDSDIILEQPSKEQELSISTTLKKGNELEKGGLHHNVKLIRMNSNYKNNFSHNNHFTDLNEKNKNVINININNIEKSLDNSMISSKKKQLNRDDDFAIYNENVNLFKRNSINNSFGNFNETNKKNYLIFQNSVSSNLTFNGNRCNNFTNQVQNFSCNNDYMDSNNNNLIPLKNENLLNINNVNSNNLEKEIKILKQGASNSHIENKNIVDEQNYYLQNIPSYFKKNEFQEGLQIQNENKEYDKYNSKDKIDIIKAYNQTSNFTFKNNSTLKLGNEVKAEDNKEKLSKNNKLKKNSQDSNKNIALEKKEIERNINSNSIDNYNQEKINFAKDLVFNKLNLSKNYLEDLNCANNDIFEKNKQINNTGLGHKLDTSKNIQKNLDNKMLNENTYNINHLIVENSDVKYSNKENIISDEIKTEVKSNRKATKLRNSKKNKEGKTQKIKNNNKAKPNITNKLNSNININIGSSNVNSNACSNTDHCYVSPSSSDIKYIQSCTHNNKNSKNKIPPLEKNAIDNAKDIQNKNKMTIINNNINTDNINTDVLASENIKRFNNDNICSVSKNIPILNCADRITNHMENPQENKLKKNVITSKNKLENIFNQFEKLNQISKNPSNLNIEKDSNIIINPNYENGLNWPDSKSKNKLITNFNPINDININNNVYSKKLKFIQKENFEDAIKNLLKISSNENSQSDSKPHFSGVMQKHKGIAASNQDISKFFNEHNNKENESPRDKHKQEIKEVNKKNNISKIIKIDADHANLDVNVFEINPINKENNKDIEKELEKLKTNKNTGNIIVFNKKKLNAEINTQQVANICINNNMQKTNNISNNNLNANTKNVNFKIHQNDKSNNILNNNAYEPNNQNNKNKNLKNNLKNANNNNNIFCSNNNNFEINQRKDFHQINTNNNPNDDSNHEMKSSKIFHSQNFDESDRININNRILYELRNYELTDETPRTSDCDGDSDDYANETPFFNKKRKQIPKWAEDKDNLDARVKNQNQKKTYLQVFGYNSKIEYLDLKNIFEITNPQLDVRGESADWKCDNTISSRRHNRLSRLEKIDEDFVENIHYEREIFSNFKKTNRNLYHDFNQNFD